MDSDFVSTDGLDKAAVLAALYNASHPQGMGFLQYSADAMTAEEAQTIIDNRLSSTYPNVYFDYLKGRVLKVDLSESNGFDSRLYDRDNGHGAAARVIAELRATSDVNSEVIELVSLEKTRVAALAAKDVLNTPTLTGESVLPDGSTIYTQTLGLDPSVTDKIDDVLDTE